MSAPDESAVEAELAEAREALSAVTAEDEMLQTVYNANRRVLGEGQVDLLVELARGIVGDGL